MAVVLLSFEKVCRGCLSENNLLPLSSGDMVNSLSQCVGLEISPNDDLPKNLCFECWDQCSKWAQFRKQYRKTEETLRGLLAFKTPTEEPKTNGLETTDGALQINPLDTPITELTLESEGSEESEEEIRLDELPQEEKTVPTEANVVEDRSDANLQSQKSLTCQRCGKKFRSPNMFEAHIREHDGLLPFVCKECGKEFKNRLTLRNHMFTHTNESYPCPDCDRKFKYPQLMEEHRVRIHTVQKKRFVCTTCGTAFGRSQTLQVHLLTHTDERPFECTECGLTFKSESYLKIHMVRHGGVKRYHCPVTDCKKEFYTLSEVSFHRRNIHSNDRQHECDVCLRRFTKKSQLTVHQRSHEDAEKEVPHGRKGKPAIPAGQRKNVNKRKRSG